MLIVPLPLEVAQVGQEEREEGRTPAVKRKQMRGDEVLRNLERGFCSVGLLLPFSF